MLYYDILIIAIGIIIAKIVTHRAVYCSPLHIISLLITYFKRKIELRRYANFYRNNSINEKGKKVLFLCHGRYHGYPLIKDSNNNPLFKVSEYIFYTVDINYNMWPHLKSDILDDRLYENIFNNSELKFDCVVLFNCSCHTMNINRDLNIMTKIRNILTDNGILLVKDKRMKVLKSAGFKLIGSDYKVNFIPLSYYKTFSQTIEQFNFPKMYYTPDIPKDMFLKCYIKCSLEEAEADTDFIDCTPSGYENYQLGPLDEQKTDITIPIVTEEINPSCYENYQLNPLNEQKTDITIPIVTEEINPYTELEYNSTHEVRVSLKPNVSSTVKPNIKINPPPNLKAESTSELRVSSNPELRLKVDYI
jgi:hypothetical protein